MKTILQIKSWLYWKSKIRWMQMWNNYKLFNLRNTSFIPLISILGMFIGIFLMFGVGFGIAYGYKAFITADPLYLWMFILFLSVVIEGIDNGLHTGKWVASANEESWLLANTPINSVKYIVFLWLDEFIWSLRTTFFSTTAGIIGVLLVFPVSFKNIVLMLFLSGIIFSLISFAVTLLQYYMLKKSHYLKGKGFVPHIVVPIVVSFFAYKFARIVSTWILDFPGTGINNTYLNWIKQGFNDFLVTLNEALGFLSHDSFIHVALAKVVTGNYDSTQLMIISAYIIVLVTIIYFFINISNRKDHNKTITSGITEDFVTFNARIIMNLIPGKSVNSMQVNLFVKSLVRNYLTSRHLFSVFGGVTWPIIVFSVTFIYSISASSRFEYSLLIGFVLAFLIPNLLLTHVAYRMRTKLNFDAEGIYVQSLLAYGASPADLYKLKRFTLIILTLLPFIILQLISLLFLKLSLVLVFYFLILTLSIYVVNAKYILMYSVLVPHYEHINEQQIGNYPDQLKMKNTISSLFTGLVLPVIPIVYYLENVKGNTLFLFITCSVWITLTLYITERLLNGILEKRLCNFTYEEIQNNRNKSINSYFWKSKTPFFVITILSYILFLYLTITGNFTFAIICGLLPSTMMNLLFIMSYNANEGGEVA